MSHLRAWCLRFSGLFGREQKDRELAEELESHLQMHIDDNVRTGMSPEEARRQALITLGGIEQTKEYYRVRRGILWLETLLQDLRYTLRGLVRNPGFTAVTILTLALGIGATTAIFTLVHAVLLNSLPVTKPGELYRVGDNEICCVRGGLEDSWSLFSYDQYKTFRDNTPGFVELAAFQAGASLTNVRQSGGERLVESQWTEFVSGNYFATFGIAPFAGRMLTTEDDRQGSAPVAVMSYRVWQQKYGDDLSVVGSSFVMNGRPFTIVGIAAPAFFGDRLGNYREEPPAFWMPLSDERLMASPSNPSFLDFPQMHWLDLIGRIAAGANPIQIEAQMETQLQEWLLSPAAKLEPEERKLVSRQMLHLSPGGAGIQELRNEYQSSLHLLMWISLLVLIIACTNVAGLMLVRATMRKQQSSIRAALGASASRQIRQVLTESLVLSLIGGLAGVLLAYVATSSILHLAFQRSYVAITASPSVPVLAFTLVISVFTGILFSAAPAWITTSAAPIEALRGAGRSVGGSGLVLKSFVITQAALSLVLLSAAGLLTQSLRNMHDQNFGFKTRNRYILHINFETGKYEPEQLPALYRRLQDSLGGIPGVSQVSFSVYSPFEGNNWGAGVYLEGDAPPPPNSNENLAYWVRVSAGYFETLGIKIIGGRPFSDRDSATSQPVAIVNRAFAKKFFKDASAIGKHFGNQEDAGAFEIVGIAEDTVYNDPTKMAPPMFFLPATQTMAYNDPRSVLVEKESHYFNSVELRTAGVVPDLEAQVRRTLAGVDPSLSITDFTPFATQVDSQFRQQSMIAKLTTLFGFLALTLACVGLYGVTAYSVQRRTNEMGVRMALGSGRLRVFGLVLRGALLEVGLAMAIGIPATIVVGWMMAAQLFGVKPYEPTILLVAMGGLVLATLVAAAIPARRATKVEPMTALRYE